MVTTMAAKKKSRKSKSKKRASKKQIAARKRFVKKYAGKKNRKKTGPLGSSKSQRRKNFNKVLKMSGLKRKNRKIIAAPKKEIREWDGTARDYKRWSKETGIV